MAILDKKDVRNYIGREILGQFISDPAHIIRSIKIIRCTTTLEYIEVFTGQEIKWIPVLSLIILDDSPILNTRNEICNTVGNTDNSIPVFKEEHNH